MQKAKVSKVTKMDKKDNYGNTSYIVEFENGDKGFYTSKSEDQKTFIVGQESEYILEKKTGSTGKEYNKITVPAESKFGNFKSGKPPIDPKVQMISFAMSYTKDLIVAKVITMQDMEKTFETMYKIMTTKL